MGIKSTSYITRQAAIDRIVSMSFKEVVTELFGELASNQEPLGSEFEQVLHENLWDLYQAQPAP